VGEGCAGDCEDEMTQTNSMKEVSEQLSKLEEAKQNAPTLAHYWYWCHQIEKQKMKIDLLNGDRKSVAGGVTM
jgi:hypothetical protein